MEYTLLALIAMFLFGFSRVMYISASRVNIQVSETPFLALLYLTGAIVTAPLAFLSQLDLGSVLTGLMMSMLSLVGAIALYRANMLSSPAIVNTVLGLNFSIPVVLGILIFQETFTHLQLLGLALTLIIISLSALSELSGTVDKRSLKGILYALVTFVTWGLLGILVKMMYTIGQLLNYALALLVMYLTSTVILMSRNYIEVTRHFTTYAKYGLPAGVLSAVGSYLSMVSFAQGQVSITSLILRFSYIIPVTYSIVVLKERLDFRKVFTILLSIPAIILLTV